MAEESVSFLLQSVQKLLKDQYRLISGAENELRLLQGELEQMKEFLKKSAERREEGELLWQHERQIREAVYEAEDTIDECLTQDALSADKSILNIKKVTKRLNLAKTVKSVREERIKKDFFQARMDINSLPLPGAAPPSPNPNPQTLPRLREDNIVGFGDEAKTLIDRITQDSTELDVISIVGMPGLGKTTLAWKIYRDQKIKYEFPIVIWAYVSQDHNIRAVFLKILEKLNRQDLSNLNDQDLAAKIREWLQKSKFLLFLDDIWTCKAWDLISDALPKKNVMGKVVITSRNEQVARYAGSREPHRLRFLTAPESWELLQLEVFGDTVECPSDLEVRGKIIATECKGVPLAIVVIGGILRKKQSEGSNVREEWKNVSENVSAYQLKHDDQKITENIIRLSYDKLPHNLRDCFVYLGMFPEDFEIPTWKLIRLWIAEGFVQGNAEKSLEKVAEDNLKELVARNLVMVEKLRPTGEIKACRVHDMIREFCIGQAAFDRDNVFQEVKFKEDEFYPATSDIPKFRRLCIHSYIVDFLKKKPKGRHVRSFMCFSNPISLDTQYMAAIPEAFQLLRVLDVNPIKFPRFPPKITKLIHLRYIVLSGENLLTLLPETILKLWNLQTIRIDTTSRTMVIKADISKMTQLRHVKSNARIIIKEMKGRAENLQTLSYLEANSECSDVIEKSPYLKTLGIRGKLENILEAKCFEKLNLLQKLKLVHDMFPDANNEKPLRRLLRHERFPPNLKILTLSATHLKWDNMATLGMLRNLEVLKLKENAFRGKNWSSDGSEFPSLEYLHIGRTDLEFWTRSMNHPFPKLKHLVLKNCDKLQEIPPVLEMSLQVLDLERVTKSIVEFGRKIEQSKREAQVQNIGRRDGFKLITSAGDGR